VEGSVADHLLGRVRHALAELDPSANPYATWILTGTHGDALPQALRAEHFDTIRGNLDRLEWHRASIESLLDEGIIASFDRANLSDIFEYMSTENATALFERLAEAGRPGARLAYWNMMVPRRASELLPSRFRRLEELSRRLFLEDKAFFYRDFVVDEVVSPA
jgi:S-adenosylmethionine-diacylglycerol 3-amino-3-carboxypropyl transferase